MMRLEIGQPTGNTAAYLARLITQYEQTGQKPKHLRVAPDDATGIIEACGEALKATGVTVVRDSSVPRGEARLDAGQRVDV